MWTYGISTYKNYAVARAERIYEYLSKVSTSLPTTDCHLETDKFPILKLDYHMQYQILVGMLQQIVFIGRPELIQLVTSLNRFGACLREAHLDIVVRAFGYLRTTLHKVIVIATIRFIRQPAKPNTA